jgi:hypothetical protein
MPLADLISGSHALLFPFRRCGMDSTRGVVRLMLVLRYVETLPRPRDWKTLLERLKRQGVDVQFKYKGQTDEIQGIVFTMNGYRFNGSKVDRQFSYSKIDAVLNRNNYEERQIQPQPQTNREEISPISSVGGELINGSLGLFSPSNMPDEQQPYDPYLKNKKKKKQRKINW